MTPHILSVLQHTSRNGRYVTNEPAVFAMADKGLLRDHGHSAIWPEGVRGFTLSAKGREALNEHYANECRFPQPKPKRKPSEAFIRWRDYCEAFQNISFSQFWKEVWPKRRNYA